MAHHPETLYPETLFEFLPFYKKATSWLQPSLGRKRAIGPFVDTYFTLEHVFGALLVVLVVVFLGWRFRSSLKKQATLPDGKISSRSIMELLCDWVLGFMSGIMGEKNAKKYLPLVGSFACFILFSNLLALVPGMEPPTSVVKTNIALAVVVFILTHYEGIKSQGLKNYLKHFAGPVWLLAPLFILIELISHVARPVSLTMRLMGNMMADHTVTERFFDLVPVLVPVPFFVLGTVVAIVQTFVFCLLTTIYLNLAVSHEEHENHHEAAKPDHAHV